MGITIDQWRSSIRGWTWRNIGLLTESNMCRESFSSPWFQLLVLAILLIIGGVEMNPGPKMNEMPTFQKTKGFADMAGENYEWKISALLFLRALQRGQQFQLASNMEAAGSFDDVVLTLDDCTLFLQLKHKKNSETVLKLRDLTRDTNFKLLKYLNSFLDIKQRWQENPDLLCCGKFEKAKFIIYTNARIYEGLVNTASNARLLNIVSTGGKCVCLTRLFQNLSKYKAVLSAAVDNENITDTPDLWEVVHKLYNQKAQYLPSRKQLQELLEHLESLGDFARYEEFISQVYLCTEQSTEKDLDDLIKRKINSVCGTDKVVHDFMDGIQNWWKNSNCYLTDQAKFFQDIIKTIAVDIFRSPKDVSEIKVKFVDNECDIIRQHFKCGNRMLYIHTQCISLSSTKVVQSFERNLLVDVNILQTRLSEVLAVWIFGMCDVLVVEGETVDTNILYTLAASVPNSKYVVVISNTNHIQLYQHIKFVLFTDTFCLSQLDLDSQHDVLERKVILQGFPVKLNSLADVSFLESAITANVMAQLHHTLQVGSKLDNLDPCYLPRTFIRKEYISKEIFREEHITLAITGISEDRLAHIVSNIVKVKNDKSCKYIVIEEETEFTALCGVNDNIHWIQACEGDFIWKRSKGNILPVIKNLEEKHVSYASAQEIVALPVQVVLVVAKPGMGKSTEMCNIAHKIKQKDPSTWLIRINLSQHTNLLGKNQVDAVEFLETVANLKTEFERHLFQYQLQSSGNVVILLDGFDEVSPIYSKQVFDLLTTFFVSKVEKIYITARTVMINELQQKLSTIAFSFEAFTPDDQKEFLNKHWNRLYLSSPNLSVFISSLLQLVGTSVNDKLKEFTGIPLQCRMLAEIFQDEASYYSQTGEIRLPRSLDVLQLYDKFIDKKFKVYCEKNGIEVNKAESLVEDYKNIFQQNLMCCAVISYLHDNYIKNLYSSQIILKQNKNFLHKFKSSWDKTGIVTEILNGKAVFVHRTFTEFFVAKWFSQNFDLELNGIKEVYFNKDFEIVQKFIDRILAQEFKLHTSVLNEDLSEVTHLLSMQNSNVNQEDNGGRTALHLAIMNYFNRSHNVNDSILETLLEHGANINCEDNVLHWRPLRLAEEIRAWAVVDKLLEKQAESTDLIWIRTNIEKQNSLQFSRSQGFVQSVISVLKFGMSVQYRMSDLLQEVMYTTLSKGYVNLVEFVLKCGVSVGHYISDKSDSNTSMIHIAAEHGQLRLVRFLIEKAAEVNTSGVHNSTPLMQAARYGHVQVVELLISHGALVNARDEYEFTALLFAAGMGKYETVKLLLQNEADVQISDVYKNTSLMHAAERGHVQIAELLIDNGASINATNKEGNTALLLAAIEGNNEIVELLLQNVGLSCITNDCTALIRQAGCGDMDAIQNLIKNKMINSHDEQGYNALSLAALRGDLEIVKLLLQKGADVNIYGDQYKKTPLMCTAVCGHVQVAQFLINHGASINARDTYGYTSLLLAAYKRKYNIVEILLQNGADIEIPGGQYNRTPLMQAALYCHVQIAELLINHGASINTRDIYGFTSLSLAACKGNCEILELLLQKGDDVETYGGIFNRTPLIEAAECGNVKAVELLINHGASINARDKYGYTALASSVIKGKNVISELLLQNGADIEISDKYERTPLMQAADSGHLQVAQLLIKNGASVNARDEDGDTALSLAGMKGKCDIVLLLLQNGAEINITDKYNRTPLMKATECGHTQVIRLLKNHGACKR